MYDNNYDDDDDVFIVLKRHKTTNKGSSWVHVVSNLNEESLHLGEILQSHFMHALLERKVVISNDDHFMIRFQNGRDSKRREREEKALRPICGYSREKGNYFPSVFPQVETSLSEG